MAHDREPPAGYLNASSRTPESRMERWCFTGVPSDEAIAGCEALGWLQVQQAEARP